MADIVAPPMIRGLIPRALRVSFAARRWRAALSSQCRGRPVAVEEAAVSRTPAVASDRVLTLPNLISFLRLVGVPIFLWLMLGPHHDVAAVIVLAVGGSSDWIDGWVARRLGQVSRLGELLDPLADRLYILAVLVAFTWREIVPWEFTAALVAREADDGDLPGGAAPQRVRPAAGALPRQDRHLHPARRVPGAAARAGRRRPSRPVPPRRAGAWPGGASSSTGSPASSTSARPPG